MRIMCVIHIINLWVAGALFCKSCARVCIVSNLEQGLYIIMSSQTRSVHRETANQRRSREAEESRSRGVEESSVKIRSSLKIKCQLKSTKVEYILYGKPEEL